MVDDEHVRALSTAAVGDWRSRGSVERLGDDDIFIIDIPGPAGSTRAPVLVLHGFPSSSFDWRATVGPLAATRRVVLFDFAGFGLSSKPDQRYSMRKYADTAESVVARSGLTSVSLLTHDMGDSVGGELLARSIDGTLDFEISSRVLTNGSIYLSLAQLTDGQNFLLALDDTTFDLGDLAEASFKGGLGATFSADHPASPEELDAEWLLAHHANGEQMLPRTIRYIEDRRAEEARYTGAIERHGSPLGVVWGVLDPIAVVAMTDRLAERRPGTPVIRLDGVGHYPMVETADRFNDAVLGLFDQIET